MLLSPGPEGMRLPGLGKEPPKQQRKQTFPLYSMNILSQYFIIVTERELKPGAREKPCLKATLPVPSCGRSAEKGSLKQTLESSSPGILSPLCGEM